MRTAKILTALGLALGLLPTAIGRADAGPLGGGRQGGEANAMRARIADLAQQLDLSDEQKQQVRSILAGERARIMPLMMQMMQTRKAMQAATPDGGPFDETQARATAARQAKTITDLLVEAQRVRSEVSAVLTPDQQAKFAQIMQQRRSERRQRFSGPSAADPLP